MTRGECGAMLAIAGRMYGKQINPDLVDAWAEFMGDVTSEEGARAMKRHVCESVHFPTVADIRKRASEDRVGPADASVAWEEVRKAIQRCGRDHEPTWSTGSVRGAVEAIGWRELCNTLDDDLPTVRAQFERYFKARVESRQRDANAGRLLAADEGKRLGPKSSADLLRDVKIRHLGAVGDK